MDEFIKIIILGIVQGITEFLPISSNAHLIMLEQLLDYLYGAVDPFNRTDFYLFFLVSDVWHKRPSEGTYSGSPRSKPVS